MIEKVNPKHPDKVADRIAGAIVDLGYKLEKTMPNAIPDSVLTGETIKVYYVKDNVLVSTEKEIVKL